MKITAKRILCMLLSGAMAVPMCACQPNFDDPTPQPEKVAENPYASAALELTLNICEDYYDLNTHVLSGEPGGGQTFAWPFGCFLEALSDTLELYPDNATIKQYYEDALDNGLKKYRVKTDLTTPAGEFEDIVYYNASAGNRGDYYYDDNAWLAIQYLKAYEVLGKGEYLAEAEELLRFFETGWDEILGGGFYWDKTFGSKNTCSEGPIAIAFIEAYEITKKKEYLEWAEKTMEWSNEKLRDEDGLYVDNISVDGAVNGWKADYNQGTPLYALSKLYEITGNKEYKTLADQTAEAALNNSFRLMMQDGALKTAYKQGGPIFKSWCVGWLMRGFTEYVKMSGEKGLYFAAMENVLDRNMIGKADENGYYDPYFGSKDHHNESETEVLQPSGVASVFAVCAYYDVYIAPKLK